MIDLFFSTQRLYCVLFSTVPTDNVWDHGELTLDTENQDLYLTIESLKKISERS